jgi:hypothetical protein
MRKGTLSYEHPEIVDHGSLGELTASVQVGGPVDGFGTQTPGHSCPTGPPLSGGTNSGDPQCNGVGSAPGGPPE